jgi:hypothetical protein
MGSPPEIGRVGFDISPDGPRQKTRLDQREISNAASVVEDRMLHLILLSLLTGVEETTVGDVRHVIDQSGLLLDIIPWT